VAAWSTETPEAERPRRPVLVELAAAILIIGSATDAAISFESMATGATTEARLLAAASVSLGLLLAILGLLIRSGRAWLVTVNLVAVAAFLELQSLTLAGLLAAVFDMVVVGILLRERWWFQWKPAATLPDDAAAQADDGASLDDGGALGRDAEHA
jgi:hypothetical protein